MNSIEIVDRASLTQGLYHELKLDPRRTAIVAIDMHRGHLDMEVATMPAQPEDARRVIANARAALDVARCLGWVISNGQFYEKIRDGAAAVT